MVLKYDRTQCLPSAEDLPDSDETPVDNELQNLIPNLLDAVLAMIWPEREDWFFGVDMGVYYEPRKPAIVPDGFLSLGVERFIGEQGRLSYVLWEEDNIPPTLALEVVSKTYGGEYERKKDIYADLGIHYYAVYRPNPKGRRQQQPLEIYELVGSNYQLIDGAQSQSKPVWLPKIGLGLGRERGTYLGREREWLYWYDKNGTRLLTPEERVQESIDRAQQEAARAQQEATRAQQEAARAQQEAARAQQEAARAQQEANRADKLAAKLKELGIDPDTL